MSPSVDPTTTTTKTAEAINGDVVPTKDVTKESETAAESTTETATTTNGDTQTPTEEAKEDEATKDGETAAESTPEEPKEMQVATKHLEERYDDKGYTNIHEAGSGPPEKANSDKWAHYVLCYTRHFNNEDKYYKSSVEIKSKPLREILRRVISDYPGVSFATDKVTLDLPCEALFHHLDDLYAELERVEDGESKDHLRYLLEWFEKEEEDTLKEYRNLLPQGLITFDLLWTIFKPGATIYTSYNGQDRAFCLKQGYRQKTMQCGMMYALDSVYTEYDGRRFGTDEMTLRIPQFFGTESIKNLNVFPISFHPKQKQAERQLIARGRIFESYQGKKYCEYSGLALGEIKNNRRVKYNISGRVMVDCETFSRIQTDRAINVTPFKSSSSACSGAEGSECDSDGEYDYISDDDMDVDETTAPRVQIPLTDTQCLHATNLVAGFALTEKKWVEYYVSKLSPIQWNGNAFDHLVLPPAQKSLVRALVESHVKETEGAGGFDDVIKGKGKGLISILHGPPGVGKTLTAESVAEFTQRPLYAVSSGELGTYPTDLEENLSQILDVATVWKAVLLLDEADVFLERRSLHDLQRNSLVSIFLRLLEYYQGILFLTTNRVRSFDDAFQSRIHVALKYNNLEESARRTVWKNFLNKMPGVDMNEAGYDILQKHVLNGRQIKNAIKTAKSLADSDGIKVTARQIETVLDIQKEFERDLKESEDRDGVET